MNGVNLMDVRKHFLLLEHFLLLVGIKKQLPDYYHYGVFILFINNININLAVVKTNRYVQQKLKLTVSA